ncbi:MAG: hypothetical protein ACRD0P_33495, partial [Stackebrandtia sp.]
PRGSLALLLLSRARAVMAGRDYVIPEDVKTVAPSALAHRISLKPELWLQNTDPVRVIAEVCDATPVPASESLPTYRSETAGPGSGETTDASDPAADPVFRYAPGGR